MRYRMLVSPPRCPMTRSVLLLSLLSFTAACTGDGNDTEPVTTDTASGDTADTSSGGDTGAGQQHTDDTAAAELTPTEPAQAELDEFGGIVEHPLVTVDVPAGAFAGPVTVSVMPMVYGIEGADPTGHPFQVSFGGAEVLAPITLTVALPLTMPDAPLYLWTRDQPGRQTVQAEALDQPLVLAIEAETTVFFATTGTHTDTFAPAGLEADFLFVIDNSGSMAEEQADISDGAADFFDLLDATPLDYHLGVTDTDCDTASDCGALYTYSSND